MSKGKITKAVGIITIISLLITFISIAYNFLLPLYLLHKYNPQIKGAGSIGIIGGADGPTSIFVSGYPSTHLVTFIFAAISLAGFVLVLFRRRKA